MFLDAYNFSPFDVQPMQRAAYGECGCPIAGFPRGGFGSPLAFLGSPLAFFGLFAAGGSSAVR